MSDNLLPVYFRFFNEIGIIAQLSRNLLESRLPPGFVMAQFTVLNHLVRVGDGRTPIAIARAFQVPKTSMTHSLSTLEKAGLIELRQNPKDGRSKLVHITESGRKFREEAIHSMAGDMMHVVQVLPFDEIETMLPSLEKLRVFLDRQRDDPA